MKANNDGAFVMSSIFRMSSGIAASPVTIARRLPAPYTPPHETHLPTPTTAPTRQTCRHRLEGGRRAREPSPARLRLRVGEAEAGHPATRPRPMPVPRVPGRPASAHTGRPGPPHRRQGRGAQPWLDARRDRPSEQLAGDQPRVPRPDHGCTGARRLVRGGLHPVRVCGKMPAPIDERGGAI